MSEELITLTEELARLADLVVKERQRPKNILLIDDDREIESLLALLTKGRYNCNWIPAVDGIEAIHKIKNTPLDFVFLDLRFNNSGPQGKDIFREIKTLRPNLPVVILSGFINEEDVESILSYGFAMFVKKPNNLNRHFIDEMFSILRIEKIDKPVK